MATAQVGWGRDTWNSGAWNTSPDARADISGITVNALLNDVFTSGNTLNNITGLQSNVNIGTAVAGSASNYLVIGLQANTAIGSVLAGEGREVTITTAGELQTDVNFGVGWGRDAWSSGPWNEGLGGFVTGEGIIFIEDGQQLTSNINSLSNVTGSVDQLIDSQLIQSNVGNANIVGTSIIDTVTGIQSNVSLQSISIQAGGSITIAAGPEIDLEISLGNISVGIAYFASITGQELNISVNNISSIITDQILTITGEELTSSVNTISVSGSSPVTITGNSMTISLSNANISTQQILSMTGNQANVSISTLKFWDPIQPTITEIWTNIH